jgi:hypothetical protein
MFHLFSKNNMNKEAAMAFWAWFEEQEEWIIDCIAKHDAAFIWAMDEKLKPVFPYFRKELEFQLGYNNGIGEFFFFHFGKKDLARDAEILGNMMPPAIKKNWRFILER